MIARVVDGQKIELPEFKAVPPMFMQGGGSYTAHPIAVGDYALLIFTERCFDNWYGGVDNETPLEYRMHDYSDGFAIVGVNPLGGAIAIPDRITHIGDAYQEGDYEHEGDREQTGNFDLTGNMTITGDLTVTGNGGSEQVNMDADLVQVAGREIHDGRQVSGTFDVVTVVDGIVVGGS